MFSSLRARLVIAFAVIVAVALILVLASLPRLLDGYFAEQAAQDLRTRTGIARSFVATALLRYRDSEPETHLPILQATDPPTITDGARQALGSPDDGYVRELAEAFLQANVTITISPDPEQPQIVAYRLHVPLPDDFGQPGQERENISFDEPVTIEDLFWSQAGAAAPLRLVTVRLSEPFTYRAQTLETIVSVMTVSAIVALLVAMIASFVLAERLTKPISRLTGAARELSEGNLDVRVRPPTGSPEMSELTAAFNAMAERLQQSIEFISRDRDRGRDFLADVSHELRTPIAALRTFNELLSDGAAVDPATRREFLDQSRQQIERLDWLATNLLELSKLDSGLVLLDLRPDDLRAVVESAVQQAQPAAERKGIELKIDLPAQPIRQRHDPQRMGQVLGNLVGNAVKFTPPGGRVEVSLRPTDEGAELRVVDTGLGIEPTELPYVFDRFYRGAMASESRAAGSGLGLSIVRSVVEMHNGRVEISSTPGKGTHVAVSLPRDMSVSSPSAVQS
ncbi:MAG TPA: HAMP domain-containing sensor histidine kinase [Candidatus Limnocylindria bacterium]|nr:HAMP domain-containing sensor histidine kinase [Candidatus Limnocylindria bacterium]